MHSQEFKQGLLLGAIIGAGASYILYKNRKQIASKFWKIKAKADIHRRLANMKRVTKEEYEELVDTVLEKYSDAAQASRYEIKEFAEELKDRWSAVKSRIDRELDELADDRM